MAYFNTEYGDIFYRLYGKGESTLVFVNGAAMSTNGWSPFLSTLTKKYRVLLLDLLDQGRTRTIKKDYTLQDQAYILNLLLEELNIDKVHLAGMSYGGKISLTFAKKYGDKLESLSLINTDSYNSNFTKELSKSWLKAGQGLDGDLFASVILTSMYSLSYYDNYYDLMKDKENFFIDNLDKEYYERFKRGVLSAMDYDLRDELKNIKVPTLVLTSDEDFVIPKGAQKLIHDGIKGSKWVLIENAGHAVMYEKPEVFINTIIEFLDQTKNGQ